MRKKILLLGHLMLLIFFGCILMVEQGKMVHLKVKEDQIYISIRIDDRTEIYIRGTTRRKICITFFCRLV